jgi:hypothetical protein
MPVLVRRQPSEPVEIHVVSSSRESARRERRLAAALCALTSLNLFVIFGVAVFLLSNHYKVPAYIH